METIPASALAWVRTVLGGAQVDSFTGMRDGLSPWLVRLSGGAAGTPAAVVVRIAGSDDTEAREGLALEACALEIAAAHDVPAPRLLAYDGEGAESGAPALLVTALEGSSKVPVTPSPDRLSALGAACARLHRTPLTPAEAGRLPVRVRPIGAFDFAAVRRERGTKGLVADAEQAVAGLEVPQDEPVLVHGDLWQGNTMWLGERLTGLVDWDCTGVGSYGVDLGSARCDAAVMYGHEYAAPVLDGWRRASGRDAENLAYWDVVAALSTPPEMAEFVSPIQQQGRPDLDQPLLAGRRDAFLRAALERLG